MKSIGLPVRRIITTLIVLSLSALCHGVLALGELPLFRQQFRTGTAEELGTSVAITPDGRRLAIGTRDGGIVYVYDRDGSELWDQTANLSIPGIGSDSLFGQRIGISFDGNLIAVGAPFSSFFHSFAGALCIFQFNGSEWKNVKILADSSPESNT